MRINRPFFRHFVVESLQTPDNLNSIEWLDKNICRLLNELEIKIVKKFKYKFNPRGISLVYILSSSHIAIHTYPENEYLHIDMITCSKNSRIKNFPKIALSIFGENSKVKELKY